MARAQPARNSIKELLADEALVACGLKAEIVGPRSIKISRNGHFMGVWRQLLGSYDWYPAGYNVATHRVPTPADAVRHIVATLRVSH